MIQPVQQNNKNKKYLILSLTASFVFVSLLASTWILLSLYNEEKDTSSFMASVGELSGDILYIENTTHKRIRAYKGLKLFKYDRLLIAEDSFAVLDFKTGHQLKVLENSEINIRFWDNSVDDYPIFVSLRHGKYKWLKQGPQDQVILETDDRLIQISKDLPSIYTYKAPITENNNTMTMETLPQDPQKSMSAGSQLKPTNKDISFKIKSYLEQFQKCQLNALGRDLSVKGQMNVAFSITPIGKTENIFVISSNTGSDQLDACVKSIFERMTFQKFSGDPIVVSYPLRFE